MITDELSFEEIFQVLRIPPKFRQEHHVDLLVNNTKNVSFFKRITIEQNSEEIHRECCQMMSLEEYSKSDVIVNFGDKGEKFYIILKGSVSVLLPVKKSIKMRRVQAQNMTKVLEKDPESSSESDDLDNIEMPINKERREGIAVTSASDIIKNLQNEQKISEALELQEINNHGEIMIAKLFEEKLRSEKKDLIRVVKNSENEFIEIEVNELENVSNLQEGDSFGELALISDRPRAATIQANTRTSLLVIQKQQFKRILGEIAEKRLNLKLKYLQSLNYFHSWSKSALNKISVYFENILLTRNQYLFSEDQLVKEIFFIKEGELLITKKHRVEPQIVKNDFSNKNRKIYIKNRPLSLCLKGKNESVGGYEIIKNLPNRIFSCICNSTTAEVFFISRLHFLSRIPRVEHIKDLIAIENERLFKRYTELSSAYSFFDVKIETPSVPKSTKHLKSLKFLMETFDSGNVRNRKSIQKKSKYSSIYRTLTPSEVQRAVNGKSMKIDSPFRKIVKFQKRIGPPLNFMLHSPGGTRVKTASQMHKSFMNY